uniref:Uncharacterized protein n=1 Tax=Setaria digitata TaxID=48799 RepID=A0A915PKE9_9BILA
MTQRKSLIPQNLSSLDPVLISLVSNYYRPLSLAVVINEAAFGQYRLGCGMSQLRLSSAFSTNGMNFWHVGVLEDLIFRNASVTGCRQEVNDQYRIMGF